MDEQTKTLSLLMERVADNLERLAVAIEKQNEFGQKLMTCPRCLGDGKDYRTELARRGRGGTGVRK